MTARTYDFQPNFGVISTFSGLAKIDAHAEWYPFVGAKIHVEAPRDRVERAKSIVYTVIQKAFILEFYVNNPEP